MLCYVMLCYVMLCYVMLCYVMLCYVMLCHTPLAFKTALNATRGVGYWQQVGVERRVTHKIRKVSK